MTQQTGHVVPHGGPGDASGPPPYETLKDGMLWRMQAMNLMAIMNESTTRNLDLPKIISITGFSSGSWKRVIQMMAGKKNMSH